MEPSIMRIAGDAAATAFIGPALLAVLLIIAVGYDVTSRRIPNALVFAGATLALFLHSVLPAGSGLVDAVPGGIGFLKSLAGLGVGLALLLPLYLVRAAGAGDVKLMAMVGAFVGPLDAVGAVVCTFIAGALLSLIVALKAGVLRQAARNIKLISYSAFARLAAVQGPVFDARTDTVARMPYALAIAAGTFAYLALRLFN
jgi:prepilin peptidase CpaA